MTPLKVVVLALLQGFTELFPVSSLGHTVIIPGLLGWGDLLNSDTFLPLVVMLHLGTAIALLTFFWRDWVNLIRGGLRVAIAGKLTPEVDPQGYGRQMLLVVVGTIPAGIVGVLFQKQLQNNFSIPLLASALLVANGAVLLTVDRLSGSQRYKAALEAPGNLPSGEIGRRVGQITVAQAVLVGCAQIFALFPGFSRSGLTMAAGLAVGLSYEASARFAFLLATPLIFGAGAVEIPQLFSAGSHAVLLALGGGVLSGIVAYLSVRFLMRYFETRRLDIFAFYCVLAGLAAFAYFLVTQYGSVI
jgi:undecaprenyl-diphosphatase